VTLESTLHAPGRLVAAWDLSALPRQVIVVYATSDAGARALHREQVDANTREHVNDVVRERGVRIGNAHGEHVWVFDERGAGVWTATASIVEGSWIVLGTRAGGVKVKDIEKVVTHLDRTACQIRCQIKDGRVVPILDAQVTGLPWPRLFAQDLAMWLGVPHVGPDGNVTNERQLALGRQLRAFADRIEAAPGAPASVDLGGCELRLVPEPTEPLACSLALQVLSRDGMRSSSRRLKRGTVVLLGAYLRRLRTADELAASIDELADRV
jgi:hypothetical protein